MPPRGGRGCRLALRLSPLLPPLLLLLLLPWTPLVGGHILSAAHHPGVQVNAQCPRLIQRAVTVAVRNCLLEEN